MIRQRILSLVLTAALVAASPVAAQTAASVPASKTLDIYVTDTEGGKATLFVSPSGETVLVDTGNPGDRDLNRIVQVLGAAGVKKIDYLISTHYHRDHIGGLTGARAAHPDRARHGSRRQRRGSRAGRRLPRRVRLDHRRRREAHRAEGGRSRPGEGARLAHRHRRGEADRGAARRRRRVERCCVRELPARNPTRRSRTTTASRSAA